MLIKSLWVALSAFSVIPVPQYAWDDNATKYSICFLPIVGVVCGIGAAAWYTICSIFSMGALLFSAGATVIPLLITGGIHMDGYMDTVDALASHQSRQRKLEIMKDSHCGAFAVIYCGIYLISTLGILHELYTAKAIPVIFLGFVLSRALSGLCAVNMPNAKKTGMLVSITANTQKRNSNIVLIFFTLVSCAGMIFANPAAGTGGVLFSLLWVWRYHSIAIKNFGGVTGDTSGYFLQVCELLLLIGALIGDMIA